MKSYEKPKKEYKHSDVLFGKISKNQTALECLKEFSYKCAAELEKLEKDVEHIVLLDKNSLASTIELMNIPTFGLYTQSNPIEIRCKIVDMFQTIAVTGRLYHSNARYKKNNLFQVLDNTLYHVFMWELIRTIIHFYTNIQESLSKVGKSSYLPYQTIVNNLNSRSEEKLATHPYRKFTRLLTNTSTHEKLIAALDMDNIAQYPNFPSITIDSFIENNLVVLLTT